MFEALAFFTCILGCKFVLLANVSKTIYIVSFSLYTDRCLTLSVQGVYTVYVKR